MKVIELLLVTIPRSLFGAIENITSGITRIIECILVNAWIYLYNIEMIVLIVEMISLLLTHEVEKTLGAVRYYNKKVAG